MSLMSGDLFFSGKGVWGLVLNDVIRLLELIAVLLSRFFWHHHQRANLFRLCVPFTYIYEMITTAVFQQMAFIEIFWRIILHFNCHERQRFVLAYHKTESTEESI